MPPSATRTAVPASSGCGACEPKSAPSRPKNAALRRIAPTLYGLRTRSSATAAPRVRASRSASSRADPQRRGRVTTQSPSWCVESANRSSSPSDASVHGMPRRAAHRASSETSCRTVRAKRTRKTSSGRRANAASPARRPCTSSEGSRAGACEACRARASLDARGARGDDDDGLRGCAGTRGHHATTTADREPRSARRRPGTDSPPRPLRFVPSESRPAPRGSTRVTEAAQAPHAPCALVTLACARASIGARFELHRKNRAAERRARASGVYTSRRCAFSNDSRRSVLSSVRSSSPASWPFSCTGAASGRASRPRSRPATPRWSIRSRRLTT